MEPSPTALLHRSTGTSGHSRLDACLAGAHNRAHTWGCPVRITVGLAVCRVTSRARCLSGDRLSLAKLMEITEEAFWVQASAGFAHNCGCARGEELVMSHVRIGIYTLTSGTAQEVADLAREGMLSVFRAQPGFGAYGLAQTQEGKFVSVSLWESAEQAQQANELAASWVGENLAGKVRLEGTQVGDFMFYESA